MQVGATSREPPWWRNEKFAQSVLDRQGSYQDFLRKMEELEAKAPTTLVPSGRSQIGFMRFAAVQGAEGALWSLMPRELLRMPLAISHNHFFTILEPMDSKFKIHATQLGSLSTEEFFHHSVNSIFILHAA